MSSESLKSLLGNGEKNEAECDENDVKTSSFETFFNIFNTNMGTGILAIPYVIKLTGYWGVFLVILIAFLGNYTGKLLIYCLKYTPSTDGKPLTSYADLGNVFWPNYGWYLVHVTNFFEQFSHCTLFLIMCGTVLHHTFPNSGISESVWISIISLSVLPYVFLRNMHHISWISFFTVLVAMGSSTCVLGYSIAHHSEWKPHTMAPFQMKHIAIAIGVTTVTYASTAYLPSIEQSMRYEGEFNAIMDFTYTLITLIKYNYGIIVYFMFLKHTEQIMTLSLPMGPFRTVLCLAVVLTALLFYAVPMYTLYDIVEKQLNIPFFSVEEQKYYIRGGTISKYGMRLVFILLSILVAVLVPHFGLLMAFVGSFTGTILVFVYPCIFHVKLHHHEMRWYHIAFDVAIATFGIVGCVLGVTYSTIQITKEYDFYRQWGIIVDED